MLIHEQYHVDGELHREGGPASIRWNYKGVLINEIYYIKGVLHR